MRKTKRKQDGLGNPERFIYASQESIWQITEQRLKPLWLQTSLALLPY